MRRYVTDEELCGCPDIGEANELYASRRAEVWDQIKNVPGAELEIVSLPHVRATVFTGYVHSCTWTGREETRPWMKD